MTYDELLLALAAERHRPRPPCRWEVDTPALCADRRRVLVDALDGFKLRRYRQRSPEEMADTPSLARSRRAA